MIYMLREIQKDDSGTDTLRYNDTETCREKDRDIVTNSNKTTQWPLCNHHRVKSINSRAA